MLVFADFLIINFIISLSYVITVAVANTQPREEKGPIACHEISVRCFVAKTQINYQISDLMASCMSIDHTQNITTDTAAIRS